MHESIATTVGLGRQIPSVFSKSFNALSPHVRDSTSGILIGAVIDVTRRIFDALWSWISTNCTITATFESGNEAFEWISEWLAPTGLYLISGLRRDRKASHANIVQHRRSFTWNVGFVFQTQRTA
ncbi:hypothetical protein RHS04_08181 [Rhizoctonia solani]|uniref:BCS1 N-terminal domain-containing protein n=1 Tax=Rhizoctonia solani TaxID=456999 RepID=A0A8H7LFY8_9AGAM|nr:hypothetical protein RHS04_08181 [Rhizoctonia solani]